LLKAVLESGLCSQFSLNYELVAFEVFDFALKYALDGKQGTFYDAIKSAIDLGVELRQITLEAGPDLHGIATTMCYDNHASTRAYLASSACKRPVSSHSRNPEITSGFNLRNALACQPSDLLVINGFPPHLINAVALSGLDPSTLLLGSRPIDFQWVAWFTVRKTSGEHV